MTPLTLFIVISLSVFTVLGLVRVGVGQRIPALVFDVDWAVDIFASSGVSHSALRVGVARQ